jgi:hypothetical protein
MAIVTFNALWNPNNVPTNVATATIGIVDQTTQITVVSPGTAMTNESAGVYSYEYSSAVAGHLYLGTMVLTATNGVKGNFQQEIFVPASAPGSNPPVTSSGQMVGLLQQQLADITAAKNAASLAITTVLSLGSPGGVSYNISGRAGSESVDLAGFLSIMQNQVKAFTELEMTLLENLQNLQPFDIRQPVGIRRRWGW